MTATQFIYRGWLDRLHDLDNIDVGVVLVGPAYIPDATHVDTGDLSDVVSVAPEVVACSVAYTSGAWRATFDTVPSFDTTGVTEVYGFVVYEDSSGELVAFHEDTLGASPANPYELNAPDGFAQTTDVGSSVTSVNGLTGDVLLSPAYLLDTDHTNAAEPGYVLAVNDAGDGFEWNLPAAGATPEAWHDVDGGGEPAFQGDWSAVANTRFYMDPFNRVWIEAVVTGTIDGTTPVWSMPSDRLPDGDFVNVTATSTDDFVTYGAASVALTGGGDVIVGSAAFDNIVFVANYRTAG